MPYAQNMQSFFFHGDCRLNIVTKSIYKKLELGLDAQGICIGTHPPCDWQTERPSLPQFIGERLSTEEKEIVKVQYVDITAYSIVIFNGKRPHGVYNMLHEDIDASHRYPSIKIGINFNV